MNNSDLPIIGKIQIPCRITSLTFDKKAYREELLSDIIETEEFNKILDESSKIIGDALEKKRQNDDVKLPNYMIVLSTISVILAILYIIALVLATSRSLNSTFFTFIGIACILIAAVMTFFLSIVNFFRKIKKFKTIENFIKDDLDLYLDKVNENLAGKCEFKFLPHRDNMIELITFIKTPTMLRDELIESNKLIQVEQAGEGDKTNKLEDSERMNLKKGEESKGSLNLKSGGNDKRKNKMSKVGNNEIEMASVSSAENDDDKFDKSQKKKFGGFKLKK